MHLRRSSSGHPGRFLPVFSVICVASSLALLAQVEPIAHRTGQNVTPSYEGWYKNADGTTSLVFGYFNRNNEEEVDIPIGPNNKIEPGQPDQGQPTHFLKKRQTGVFAVIVPKDWGDKKVTWTLTAHGRTDSIPSILRPEWEIDALKEKTSGNTPPVLKFEANGTPGQGPAGVRTTMSVTLPNPATINLWATDDGVRKNALTTGRGASRPPVLGLGWSKYRGPGTVTFSQLNPKIDANGKATTTATFSEPGDYMLRVLAWDDSGGQGMVMAGGFFCCWTNGYAIVHVKDGGKGGH
jgi:hypothetical protein